MRPEAQKIAIGTFCGFRIEKRETWPKRRPKRFEYVIHSPDEPGFLSPEYLVDRVNVLEDRILGEGKIPNYFSDLNAVAKAEERLSDEQWERYAGELERSADWDDSMTPGRVARANRHRTPADCAEALLKAIGKWEI